LVIIISRFLSIIAPIALAAGIGAKKSAPFGPGTLRDDTFTFGCLLFGTIVIGTLLFLPVAALGPLAEHLGPIPFEADLIVSNCNTVLQSAMNPHCLVIKKSRIYTLIFLACLVRYWKFINPRRILNESRILVAVNVLTGSRRNGVVLPVHDRVRKDLRRAI
jgi:hypothetical protein